MKKSKLIISKNQNIKKKESYFPVITLHLIIMIFAWNVFSCYETPIIENTDNEIEIESDENEPETIPFPSLLTFSININYTNVDEDKIKQTIINFTISNNAYHTYGNIINNNGGTITLELSELCYPLNIDFYISVRLDNNNYMYSDKFNITFESYMSVFDLGTVNFDYIKISGSLGEVNINGKTPDYISGGIIFSELIHDFVITYYKLWETNNIWETYIKPVSNPIEGLFFIDFLYYESIPMINTSHFRYYIKEPLIISKNNILSNNLGDFNIITKNISGIVKNGDIYSNKFTIVAFPNKIFHKDDIQKNMLFSIYTRESVSGNWSSLMPETFPENVWVVVAIEGKLYITTSAIKLNDSILDIQEMLELN